MSLFADLSVNLKIIIPVSITKLNLNLCGNKIYKFFVISKGPEKNFALESYGNHSKCFDHTDSMWEERSCRQTREWQHWGSGCYKYRCEKGRLHILVYN